jgi:hypothetical protein
MEYVIFTSRTNTNISPTTTLLAKKNLVHARFPSRKNVTTFPLNNL